ncbi:MAG: ABC transporter substrate-binding protein, partial [Pseudomonadota bacterium]
MKFTRILGAAAVAAMAGSVALPALAAGHAGGTLVIATTQTARHLNGAVQSGTATAVPSTQIFASPLRYDEGWNPQPYLAESWEVSEDGLTFTLNLRAGATFHDGQPITSEDVAYSIMTTKANHPFKSMFDPVESIDSSDPLKAVIKLSKPHPALLLALSPALAPVMPKHVFDNGEDPKSNSANSAPVGSGPFMLESFTQGESIVLKKNPNFFLEGKPLMD